jgi:hypothetical protein
MTYDVHEDDNVRVIAHTGDLAYLQQRDRTPAQKHMDSALDTAEEQARASLEALTEALQWFAVVKPDYRSTLPTEVGQFIEAITETRRLRG